jgi:hypothetical protein
MRVMSLKSEIHHDNSELRGWRLGGVWRVKHDGEPVGSDQPSRQLLLRRHWQVGNGKRSSFQYRGYALSPNRHGEAKRTAALPGGDRIDVAIMSAHLRNPPS